MSEFNPPQYPALATCLVLESRHALRAELEKDLKGIDLFLEIKVAASLAAARLSLEIEQIDCCLIGSGVSESSLREFLDWAEKGARSGDCAFVLVREERLRGEGIIGGHVQVYRPLTKAKLFDAIVRGIIAANRNSTWSAIFASSEFHRQFDDDTPNPLLAGSAKSSVNTPSLDAPWEAIGAHSRMTEEDVRRLFAEKNIFFHPDGEPSDELRGYAVKLFDALFPGGAPDNDRFVKHCWKAIYGWFENAPLGGFNEATEQLKMSIMQFRG
jgi:hypothetical protein